MKFALLCAAALAAAPALADELVASNGNDSVRLSDAQCSSEKVLDLVDATLRPLMKDASATVAGESFRACWVPDGTVARLLYEDGDQGFVPMSELRKPS